MLIRDFEKLNPEQKSYLTMAEGSVERLDQTIFDMLDFANNARIDLKSESFDIREMVQEIFDDLKFMAKVPIHFQIEVEGSEIIRADRKRLKTIIKNLASNAVKYSRTDASDAFVKFRLLQDKDKIEFEISDNGIGIPSEQQEKIFEMFYRYANDTNGSGLGLFIVKEVLSKIGGTIELESQENKGSIFRVSVPKSEN
jgi:signal transduction histidine kinase